MDICKMLTNAIKDEQDAQIFYKRLEEAVDKANRWKIKEIRTEENMHMQELTAIANRLRCNR